MLYLGSAPFPAAEAIAHANARDILFNGIDAEFVSVGSVSTHDAHWIRARTAELIANPHEIRTR